MTFIHTSYTNTDNEFRVSSFELLDPGDVRTYREEGGDGDGRVQRGGEEEGEEEGEGEEGREEEGDLPQPPETSPASNYGENRTVSAALMRGNRREREREEADVRSQGRGGLLIEDPRTPRGPRIPNFA